MGVNCTAIEPPQDGDPKRPHTTSTYDAHMWSAAKKMNDSLSVVPEKTIDEVLPEAMLMEILSRLPDAWDLVNCAAVNRIFRSTYRHVKVVRFLYKREDSRRKGEPSVSFKETVAGTIQHLTSVENLRLEIEDAMQASRYKDEDCDIYSLWLSQQSFIYQWLPPWVSKSLQTLTVIDYGQQAIFHATPLLQILAAECKQLRTLELRNMFLDCRKLGEQDKLTKLTTLTLRCVKLTDTGLSDLNRCMPNLDTLTLVTVVGLREAEFKSDNLKVLCLGLATKVKSVKLVVKHLVKLQLKMACPDKLTVEAPDLECLAVCMDKRDKTQVEFQKVRLLKELLMGASEFSTLTNLSSCNQLLEKVFLDVPCMAFEDSGLWKGVLTNVPLAIPNMEEIRSCCPNLQTLSVGPGLWYALEEEHKEALNSRNESALKERLKWPTLRRLIVHLIVQKKENSMGLLTALVRSLPSLTLLEVYVHKDSKVDFQDFSRMKLQFSHLELKCDSWKKGLRFECFSF
jgi:hypothetical protein